MSGWDRISALNAALRRQPLLGDLCLAVVLVVLGFGLVLGDGARTSATPEIGSMDRLAFGWAVLAVLGRHRWTAFLLAVSVALVIVTFALTSKDSPPLTLTVMLLMFVYANRSDRRQTWTAVALVAAAMLLAGSLIGMADAATFGIAWVLVAAALGEAARNRRAYISEVEERALQAEQSREEEAQLRVAQERIRIARELHDVVAHHIAAVKVQASGAKHIMAHRPEQVGPALEQISRLSDAVLKEMASMIGLLRHSPDQGTLGIEPTPGLDRLPALLSDFALSGLKVQYEQTGTARALPLLADLAAYRIIQEGLTNAQKYGTGSARLDLSYVGDAVTIGITNALGRHLESAGTGHGLLGMSERVAANGGTFSAGPGADGTFVVRAELAVPLEQGTR